MPEQITSRTVSFNDLTEINRKRLLLTTISFLIITYAYGLIINVVITDSIWAIIGFATSLTASIGIFVYYLLSKNSRLTATITVAILVLSFLAYLEISISSVFALFFFPITIIITFYLMGRRAGLIISALVFASTILYVSLRPGVWSNTVFDANAFANFVISAFFSIALILLYEITLVEAYVKLIRSNKMLETMSVTDALTGLNNRKWIDGELAQRLENARKGKGFAVFVIDFDDFKQINDEFGHIAGDQALQSFADLMRL